MEKEREREKRGTQIPGELKKEKIGEGEGGGGGWGWGWGGLKASQSGKQGEALPQRTKPVLISCPSASQTAECRVSLAGLA